MTSGFSDLALKGLGPREKGGQDKRVYSRTSWLHCSGWIKKARVISGGEVEAHAAGGGLEPTGGNRKGSQRKETLFLAIWGGQERKETKKEKMSGVGKRRLASSLR